MQKFLYSGGKAINNAPSAAKNYRVRLKALYNNANNLKIRLSALDNLQGAAIAFPNYLQIKTTGSYKESNQVINVAMPRFAPTLGIFDYVLFSEESISK